MMKRLLFLLTVGIYSSAVAQQSVTTFILIRHAEKGNDGTNDPDLADAGRQRAESLSRLLTNTKVDAIYSTAFKRTQNTVGPLSRLKGLSILTYDIGKMGEKGMQMGDVDAMLKKFNGGTIVVCGHSNTVPAIINYLTGRKDEYKSFEDGDYGNVIIVSMTERGNAKVVWLKY